MRYCEIIIESQLHEGFLDAIASKVGGMVKKPFQMVNNTTTSLIVMSNVLTDETKCETICFLLRKQLGRQLQGMPQIVRAKLQRVIPRGYSPRDFLGMLVLLPALSFIGQKSRDIKGDTLGEMSTALIGKLTNLNGIVNGIVSAGANGIFGAFQMLGLADQLLFGVLNGIHQKMKAI